MDTASRKPVLCAVIVHVVQSIVVQSRHVARQNPKKNKPMNNAMHQLSPDMQCLSRGAKKTKQQSESCVIKCRKRIKCNVLRIESVGMNPRNEATAEARVRAPIERAMFPNLPNLEMEMVW